MRTILWGIGLLLAVGCWTRQADAAVIVNAPKSLGLNQGLVGYWPFDGKHMAGSRAFDASGQGNHGTLTGSNGLPVRTAGKIGQGMEFDGSNDYVSIGDPASGILDFGTNSFSYGLWVNVSAPVAGFDMPWWKGGASAGSTGYDMELGTGKWVANFSDGTQVLNVEFAGAPILDQWVHLIVVVDRSANTAYAYTNGVRVDSRNLSGFGSVSSSNAAFMGRNSGGSFIFRGIIDDVRIYNRALSRDEIKRLYKIGGTARINTSLDGPQSGLVGWWTFDGPDMSGATAYDRSGQGNHGTIKGGASVTKIFSTTASTTFTVPSHVTQITVEAWGGGGAGGGQNLASDGGSGGGGGGYSRSVLTVTPNKTYTLDIGTGGAGVAGGEGNGGGDSNFWDGAWNSTLLVRACGGKGGDPSTGTPPTTGHDGGQASCGTGDTKFSGGAGGNGEDAAVGEGGGGGESGCTTINGNAGAAGTNPGGAGGTGCDGGDGGKGGDDNANGSPGISPGGGGGGSGEGVPVTGGAGADGQIKITYSEGPARVPGRMGQGLSFENNSHVNVSIASGNVRNISLWVKPNTTNQNILLKVRDDTDWAQVGNGLTITGVGVPALAALNSTDVAFIDATNDSLRTYRFDGTNWAQVGNGLTTTDIGTPALAALNSTDVAFIDAINDSLRTYRFDGTNWAQVGYSLALAAFSNAALAALNSTDVAFIDSINDSLRTYRFDGTDWAQVWNGLTITGVGAPALAALNSTDVAFIDSTNDSLRTYRFDYFLVSFISGAASSTLADPSFYVNGSPGSRIATGTWTHLVVTTDTAVSASAVEIGNDFNGEIDDVRIYNRTLSKDEIKRLYKIGGTAKINTAIPGPTQGLVGHWTFDGKHMAGNRAYDASGQGNYGILTNGPIRTIGRIGQALDFDGSNDFVDLGSTGLPNSNSSQSISAWAYYSSAPTAEGNLVTIGTNPDRAVQLGFRGSPVHARVWKLFGTDLVTSGNLPEAGMWHHYVYTYNGTTHSIYIDGVLLGTAATSPDTGAPNDANIGRWVGDTGYFDGVIDDVRIYNRVLSKDEIKRLYNAGR